MVLTETYEPADYYESVMAEFDDGKMAASCVMIELLRVIKEEKADISAFRVKPKKTFELLTNVKSGELNGKIISKKGRREFPVKDNHQE